MDVWMLVGKFNNYPKSIKIVNLQLGYISVGKYGKAKIYNRHYCKTLLRYYFILISEFDWYKL